MVQSFWEPLTSTRSRPSYPYTRPMMAENSSLWFAETDLQTEFPAGSTAPNSTQLFVATTICACRHLHSTGRSGFRLPATFELNSSLTRFKFQVARQVTALYRVTIKGGCPSKLAQLRPVSLHRQAQGPADSCVQRPQPGEAVVEEASQLQVRE
jgi:hypothetical protein